MPGQSERAPAELPYVGFNFFGHVVRPLTTNGLLRLESPSQTVRRRLLLLRRSLCNGDGAQLRSKGGRPTAQWDADDLPMLGKAD